VSLGPGAASDPAPASLAAFPPVTRPRGAFAAYSGRIAQGLLGVNPGHRVFPGSGLQSVAFRLEVRVGDGPVLAGVNHLGTVNDPVDAARVMPQLQPEPGRLPGNRVIL